jgi:hypothetical protein
MQSFDSRAAMVCPAVVNPVLVETVSVVSHGHNHAFRLIARTDGIDHLDQSGAITEQGADQGCEEQAGLRGMCAG